YPISNYIYIFGGEKAANGYSDEERAFLIEGDQIFGYFSYSSINGEWTFKKQALRQDAPSARYGHSMISIDRTLYLFGGRDNQTAFNTIWKYSESEKTWEEIDTKQSESDIPEARCFHTMHLHLNKEFWILGGKDIHGKTLNDVWKFDIVKEKWTKYDTVESPISFAKAGSVLQEGKEMKIYIWGGETDTRGMLSQDIIYKYTTTIEDKDKDKDKDKKKDSNTIKCGVLGIEFVILALLFQRMRRRQ
ncbi:MAG TPA: kelch repeat-containing protein, partial [Planctomycetota bacterium]|nr:kelch repeat-containing protein [Planctomycetota bacterium]